MYVLSGPDAAKLLYEGTYEGWGGEDEAFFISVKKQRKIAKQNEPGLIHIWHPKYCVLGKTLGIKTMLHHCRIARNKFAGSPLGASLLHQWKKDVLTMVQEDAKKGTVA